LKYARMPKMGEDISEIKNNKKLFGTWNSFVWCLNLICKIRYLGWNIKSELLTDLEF
jgi:hypothetical protein